MKIKHPLALVAAVIATLIAAQGTVLAAPDPSKPNIVFIYADDWGWGDLSCHGNTWLKTPSRITNTGISV